MCGFDAYLECDAPSFAVVALRTNDPRAAERALREAPRSGGYPFAESLDALTPADRSLHGIVVVDGLFAERADAESFARALHASVLPLEARTGAYRDDVSRVVMTASSSPAYARGDLERVEHELDEAPWVPLAKAHVRRTKALAQLTPVCTIDAGRVFRTTSEALYRFRREYAPVACDDGKEAWIAWRATRLESSVSAGSIRQVILVECDVPTIETRPLGPPPPALGPLSDAGCGDP